MESGDRVIQVRELIKRFLWAEIELMQREEKPSFIQSFGIFFFLVTLKVSCLLSLRKIIHFITKPLLSSYFQIKNFHFLREKAWWLSQ
jgi:hypothetical protein